MSPASDKARARTAEARVVLKSATGRASFVSSFGHAFAQPFRRALKSALIFGALGSFAALRLVTRGRSVSSPKLDAASELGIAMAGAFVAVGVVRLVEWKTRRRRSRAKH